MSEVHGRPCWFELATSDLEAAKTFYESVIGWNINDSGNDQMTYWLATYGDDEANLAGLYPNDAMGEEVPVGWTIYIGVDDCDDTVGKVEGLGGGVVAPAMDIPGTGRFAVIADPNGAMFGILQPEPMEGEQAVNFGLTPDSVGRACWIDLATSDVDSSMAFYSDLFGWEAGEVMPVDHSPGGYQIVQIDGIPFGGMAAAESIPMAFWGVHFQVGDATKAVAAIDEHGGKVIAGPMDVPGAQVATATDPQGGVFSITGAAPG